MNLVIDDECPRARDAKRHNLRYRIDRLPEGDRRELEESFSEFLDKYKVKLRL